MQHLTTVLVKIEESELRKQKALVWGTRSIKNRVLSKCYLWFYYLLDCTAIVMSISLFVHLATVLQVLLELTANACSCHKYIMP